MAPLGDNVEMRELIASQREPPHTLARLIDGVSGEVLGRRSSPGKWSIRAIIAHMAEDELVSSWRYRQMIEHCGAVLPGFDQDLWAKLGNYDSWPEQDALQMFRLLREANLRLFAGLSPEEWQSWGIHAERGRITVEDLARHMAGHDERHIQQVRRLLEPG